MSPIPALFYVYGLMKFLNTLPGHIALVGTGLVLDQLTKGWAVARLATLDGRPNGESIPILGELLRFTDAHPPGSEDSKRLYDVLVRLAASDSKLDQREYDVMAQITKALGLPPETLYARLPAPAPR